MPKVRIITPESRMHMSYIGPVKSTLHHMGQVKRGLTTLKLVFILRHIFTVYCDGGHAPCIFCCVDLAGCRSAGNPHLPYWVTEVDKATLETPRWIHASSWNGKAFNHSQTSHQPRSIDSLRRLRCLTARSRPRWYSPPIPMGYRARG